MVQRLRAIRFAHRQKSMTPVVGVIRVVDGIIRVGLEWPRYAPDSAKEVVGSRDSAQATVECSERILRFSTEFIEDDSVAGLRSDGPIREDYGNDDVGLKHANWNDTFE